MAKEEFKLPSDVLRSGSRSQDDLNKMNIWLVLLVNVVSFFLLLLSDYIFTILGIIVLVIFVVTWIYSLTLILKLKVDDYKKLLLIMFDMSLMVILIWFAPWAEIIYYLLVIFSGFF